MNSVTNEHLFLDIALSHAIHCSFSCHSVFFWKLTDKLFLVVLLIWTVLCVLHFMNILKRTLRDETVR